MILDIVFGLMSAVIIAGGVFAFGLVLEKAANRILRQKPEDEIITIDAAKLGRELAVNPRNFQGRYYLKLLVVSGEITGIQRVQTSGSEYRHRIELDGVIACEFNELQEGICEGMRAEFSGLCLGKILTGCRIEQVISGGENVT